MASTQGTKYSPVAMGLHWLIAIGVIANWRIAEAGEHAATQADKSAIMGNHFAIGVLLFAAVVLRFAWRLAKGTPAPQSGHAGWERMLAKAVHYIFYALLLIMPLAGWFAMSKYGAPIDVWGLFALPPLPVAADPEGAKAIFEQHATAGKIMLILIVVHVLGTLKHTVLDKDGNLFRMLPFGTAKP
ncbi:MAG: cytochrome b [Sphingomonadaceae bacterium]|nr:cytochrome b [Sphingomonadaceae bacterium]